MAIQATLLDRVRMLEDRLNYLERGAAVGITGTDQTIKGSHDRLDGILGVGGTSLAMTRKVLIPATRGYVSNTSNPLHGADERGFLCDDAIDTYVVGNWYLPSDYSASLTIAAVVECGGTTGLWYGANVFYCGAVNEAYDTHNDSSGYDQVACTEEQEEVQSVSVSSVAAGDYVTCVFHRDGNNADDTATAMAVYVKGWLASYVATR